MRVVPIFRPWPCDSLRNHPKRLSQDRIKAFDRLPITISKALLIKSRWGVAVANVHPGGYCGSACAGKGTILFAAPRVRGVGAGSGTNALTATVAAIKCVYRGNQTAAINRRGECCRVRLTLSVVVLVIRLPR